MNLRKAATHAAFFHLKKSFKKIFFLNIILLRGEKMESKPKKSWIDRQLKQINDREKELGISKLTTLEDLKNEGKNENWENPKYEINGLVFETKKINWLLNKKDKYQFGDKVELDINDKEPIEIWKEYTNSWGIKVKINYYCKDDIVGEELIFYPKKWTQKKENIIENDIMNTPELEHIN